MMSGLLILPRPVSRAQLSTGTRILTVIHKPAGTSFDAPCLHILETRQSSTLSYLNILNSVCRNPGCRSPQAPSPAAALLPAAPQTVRRGHLKFIPHTKDRSPVYIDRHLGDKFRASVDISSALLVETTPALAPSGLLELKLIVSAIFPNPSLAYANVLFYRIVCPRTRLWASCGTKIQLIRGKDPPGKRVYFSY